MATATTTTPLTETGCCARFDPGKYVDNELMWDHKLFAKVHVHSFAHVPLDMGRRIRKAAALIDAADARERDSVMLSDERSPWGADMYIPVRAAVPGLETILLSGTFLTRVYEGPFRDAPEWMKDMRRFVEQKRRHLHKLYFGYTTCPRCAKVYGKNYVVLFADVTEERTRQSTPPPR
jgi:hypothetical protein